MRALVIAGLLVLVFAGPAAAADFAPLDTPGPPLSVSTATVDKATQCSPGIDHAKVAPVLLLQGTGANAKDNWSWTYEPGLDKVGIPWCAVDLPDHATGDIQINGEYVVSAIRTISARAGRRVSIIGHSQGGMVGRWALRFWPDTRAMVDDVIGFAPSNHGTTQASASCGDGSCTAADWQQWNISNFVKALNSGAETFKGISYTSVYTHTDEIVQPNQDAKTGSSSLRTGEGMRTNVATQEICPNDTNEHLIIGLYDPVAYALAIDALQHDGPADPKRIPATVCAQEFHQGINPATFPADSSAAAADYEFYSGKDINAEPALACYTTASCSASAPSPAAAAPCRRTITIRFLRHAHARIHGRRVKLHRRASGRLRLTARAPARVVIRGRTRSGKRVRIVRHLRACG